MEYFAAFICASIYNVNLKPGSPLINPDRLMARRQARLQLEQETQAEAPAAKQQHGRPAVILGPVPVTGARWAMKGERPPSRFAPGEKDGVIARYDAWVRARGARHGGRR